MASLLVTALVVGTFTSLLDRMRSILKQLVRNSPGRSRIAVLAINESGAQVSEASNMRHVVFVHKSFDGNNLGDFLASPRHYFRFTPGDQKVWILGGGAYTNFGLDVADRAGCVIDRTVVWGIGTSRLTARSAGPEVCDLPYLHWGLRDRDCLQSEKRFLPCVSCMHPMLDDPICGDGTLLYLNAHIRVTSAASLETILRIANDRSWKVLLNNCSIQDFRSHLRNCSHIVTNSYHGAYWGLLAGRRVSVIGYSSKFRSLLVSLAVGTESLYEYDRANEHDLVRSLQQVVDSYRYSALPDPMATRMAFRDRTLAFAHDLVDGGIVRSIVAVRNEVVRAQSE